MSSISSLPTLHLPQTYVNHNSVFPIIFTHGLGSTNPQTKTHSKDNWCKVIGDAADESRTSYLSYTARGHGDSSGWEDTVESDPEQFTWARLADDMIYIANLNSIDKFIGGGSSMGCATSIWAAIKYPDRFNGLILVRPPTAWADRLARRKTLLSSGRNILKSFPDGIYHHVIKATAYSDLPPPDDLVAYNSVKCPVLILAIAGDDAHPVSTAQTLHRLIPQSILHIAESETDAGREWVSITAAFIASIRGKPKRKKPKSSRVL
jgi:3-oxoadipate enol-lactonase